MDPMVIYIVAAVVVGVALGYGWAWIDRFTGFTADEAQGTKIG